MTIIDRRKGERRQGERRKTLRATGERRNGVDRRQLIKMGLAFTVAGLVDHPLIASAGRMVLPVKKLSFLNLHTDEKLTVEYCTEEGYCDEALDEVNHILRDYRTGEIKAIDPALLDLLHGITRKIKPGARIHIISGYRSPETNRALRQKSSGVAKHSLHMDGMAADIRIPGTELDALRRVALDMRGGGVGYYPKSNFVHVDTGRVRFW